LFMARVGKFDATTSVMAIDASYSPRPTKRENGMSGFGAKDAEGDPKPQMLIRGIGDASAARDGRAGSPV
jgi:hypothetical protein